VDNDHLKEIIKSITIKELLNFNIDFKTVSVFILNENDQSVILNISIDHQIINFLSKVNLLIRNDKPADKYHQSIIAENKEFIVQISI